MARVVFTPRVKQIIYDMLIEKIPVKDIAAYFENLTEHSIRSMMRRDKKFWKFEQ